VGNRTIRSAGLAVLATIGVVAGATAPAYADPAPETKTVTTHVVDRKDHGHGSPPPATWALDTFDRTVTITGGPVYVLPGTDNEVPEVSAEIAETRQKMPEITLCDLVKYLHLTWKYHAEVKDLGTFVTLAGATLSPNAGAALLGGVHGTLKGGFSADFTAPAHWCTFDASELDDETIEGDDAPSASRWVSSMFDKFDGSSINDDWWWTYTTCVEKWWDAADKDSDDGQSDEAGDITGLPCPTTPAPSTPVPTVIVNAPQLPVTGASVTTMAAVGSGLLLVGIATLLGLAAFRRRGASA
jgi:hypothetical protein